MLFCILFGKRTYGIREYLVVVVIVLSVSFFTYEDNPGAENARHHAIGIILIAFSLLMDGLAGAFQDHLRSITKPLSMNNMFHVNKWSLCILMPILAATGEGRSFIEIVQKHPNIIHCLSCCRRNRRSSVHRDNGR